MIYFRSQNASSVAFLMDFDDIFDPMQETLVVGDFNLCSKSDRDHSILRHMRNLGFKQLVTDPTHIEGRTIDLVLVYSPSVQSQELNLKVKLQSPYFTDHDIVYVY